MRAVGRGRRVAELICKLVHIPSDSAQLVSGVALECKHVALAAPTARTRVCCVGALCLLVGHYGHPAPMCCCALSRRTWLLVLRRGIEALQWRCGGALRAALRFSAPTRGLSAEPTRHHATTYALPSRTPPLRRPSRPQRQRTSAEPYTDGPQRKLLVYSDLLRLTASLRTGKRRLARWESVVGGWERVSEPE